MSRHLPRPIDVEGFLIEKGYPIQETTLHDAVNVAPGSRTMLQLMHNRGQRARKRLSVVRTRRPWTAEQLTVVRDELVEGWQFWPAEPEEGQYSEREHNLLTVLSAELWWVGSEMCELIYSAMPSTEDDAMLHELSLPSDTGLVFLERPWRGGTDTRTGEQTMIVDMFTWGRTLVGPRKDPSVSIAAYRYIDFRRLTEQDISLMAEVGLNERLGDYLPSVSAVFEGKTIRIIDGGHWAPLGRSDWPEKDALGDIETYLNDAKMLTGRMVPPEETPGFMQSTREDRQLLATFLALLQTESLATVGEHRPSRQVVRAAQRRKEPIPSPVKIVTLRRPHRPTGRTNKTGRHVSHRFPVRAHHRNQAYGPGRELRKRILVPAHVRGPEDGPFIPKETVYRLIR